MQRVHANQELYVLYYLYLYYLWPYICLFVAHQHQHPSCSPLFDCLCLSKESGDLQESAGDESVYKDSVLGAKSLSQHGLPFRVVSVVVKVYAAKFPCSCNSGCCQPPISHRDPMRRTGSEILQRDGVMVGHLRYFACLTQA